MTVPTDYDLIRIASRQVASGVLRFEVLAAESRQGDYMEYLVTTELATRAETDIITRETGTCGQPTEFGNAICVRLRYLYGIDARLHETNRQIVLVFVPKRMVRQQGRLHHTLMGMPIEVAEVIQATVNMYW